MGNHDRYSDNNQTLERELVPSVRQEIARHEAMSLRRPSGRGSHSYRGRRGRTGSLESLNACGPRRSMRTVRVILLFTCR